jgi:signal transduction histidine kinase
VAHLEGPLLACVSVVIPALNEAKRIADLADLAAEGADGVTAEGDEAAGVFSHAASVLGLPMRDDQGPVGVLVLGDARADAFEGARVPLLAFMAGQATLAVRNARAYLYSEELAISDERARIAREIHDDLGQMLTALKMDVAWLAKRLPPDSPQLDAKIDAMHQ